MPVPALAVGCRTGLLLRCSDRRPQRFPLLQTSDTLGRSLPLLHWEAASLCSVTSYKKAPLPDVCHGAGQFVLFQLLSSKLQPCSGLCRKPGWACPRLGRVPTEGLGRNGFFLFILFFKNKTMNNILALKGPGGCGHGSLTVGFKGPLSLLY